MKKWILPIVTLAFGGFAVLIVRPYAPESDKIKDRMSVYFREVEKDITRHPFWRSEFRKMQYDLAQAYIREGRVDEAIDKLITIIQEQRAPQKNIYGQPRPKISADYYFEGRYYAALAEAYKLKGDVVSAGKAQKKAAALKKKNDELKAIEDAQEARRKQRETSAVLD